MKSVRVFIFIALAALPAFAQEFKQIREGVEYAEFTRKINSTEKDAAAQATVHALRLDLKRARLDVVHALDAVIGVETTSSIATRHAAFAAVNAGFFRLDKSIFNGDPAGVFVTNSRILSESYADRIALLIYKEKANDNLVFAHLAFEGSIEYRKKQKVEIKGLNRQRKDADDLVVFTPEFQQTTLTNPNGLEIVVRNNRITQTFDGRGSTPIPKNGFVVSATGKFRDSLKNLKNGEIIKLNVGVVPKDKIEEIMRRKAGFLMDVVGGVPQLIKNGKIEITWEQEKTTKSFVETRHPRTAIAKLKDGRALLVAVDGRSESSGGMSLPELAAMLVEMGAVEAMNLDGGGSTTMFLDGKVVNRPSDKEGERPVSDAILITLRK